MGDLEAIRERHRNAISPQALARRPGATGYCVTCVTPSHHVQPYPCDTAVVLDAWESASHSFAVAGQTIIELRAEVERLRGVVDHMRRGQAIVVERARFIGECADACLDHLEGLHRLPAVRLKRAAEAAARELSALAAPGGEDDRD